MFVFGLIFLCETAQKQWSRKCSRWSLRISLKLWNQTPFSGYRGDNMTQNWYPMVLCITFNSLTNSMWHLSVFKKGVKCSNQEQNDVFWDLICFFALVSRCCCWNFDRLHRFRKRYCSIFPVRLCFSGLRHWATFSFVECLDCLAEVPRLLIYKPGLIWSDCVFLLWTNCMELFICRFPDMEQCYRGDETYLETTPIFCFTTG